MARPLAGWVGRGSRVRSALVAAPRGQGRAMVARAGSRVAFMARADSNTYVAGDGHFMTELSQVPVNYRSSSGTYVPIRTGLVRSGTGFRQAANGFSAFLPSAAQRPFGLSNGSGGISFSLPGATGAGSASGSALRFGSVLPGTGLTMRSLSYGLGWQADLAGSARGRVFRWLVDPSKGLSVRLTRRGVAFVNPAGQVAWLFSAPFARAGQDGRRLPVRMSLTRHGRGWLIRMRVGSSRKLSGAVAARTALSPAAAGGGVNPDDTQLGGTWVIGQVTYLDEASYCDLNSTNPSTSNCGYGSTNADGPTDAVGPDDNTIMNFDVSDNIPAHVRVLQAYVGLTLTGESSTTATDNVGVWQLTKSWTGSATWNTYDGSDDWTTAGGDKAGPSDDNSQKGLDFNSSVGASSINQDDPPEYYWDIQHAMQEWVDNKQPQADGLVFEDEPGGTNTLQFSNDSDTSAAWTPYVRVYWEPRMGDYPGAKYDTQQLTDKTTAGVNVANGDFMMTNKDVHLVGVNGLDVNLTRYYNSEANDDQDAFGYDWGMGTGADSYLIIPSDDANVVDYFDGTGDSEMFYVDPTSGQWIAPPGSDISMSMNASSTYDASQFTLFFRHSGITEKFNALADAANKYANLTSVTDRNNNKISYTYNDSGQLTQITDSYGNQTTINWGSNGYVQSIVDPAGRTYSYQQNSTGQLASYTDPDGNTTHYYYDASNGELDKVVTAAGNVMTVSYYAPSSVGDISQVQSVERYVHPTDSTGPERSYTYGTPNSACPNMPAGSVQTTETDENQHTIAYCTDDLSRIQRVVDGNGNYRSVSYTGDQFPTGGTGGNGNIEDPGGDPQTFGSNQTSTTLTYSSANGNSDGRDNVTQVTQGTSGPSTTFSYPPEGDDQPGTDYSPTGETDTQGNRSSFSYDSNGNLETTTDSSSSNKATVHHNQSDGLPDYSIDGDGNQTNYSQTGDNITQITPPSGSGLNAINITYYPENDYSGSTKLGAPNLIESISTVNTSNHTGHEVSYTYDGEDREKTATYQDAYGNTIATITYNYNADGYLTSEQDSRYGTDTFTLDGLNRVTSTSYYDGSSDSYTYYPGSELETLTDSGGTVTYKYDDANQLQYVFDPGAGTNNPTISLDYDNDGDLRHVIYNVSGAEVTRAYDSLDRLTSVTDTYKTSGGSPQTLTYTYGYQGDLRSSLTYQGPNGQTSTSYAYDSENRLKTATIAQTNTTYTYTSDGAGNLNPITAGFPTATNNYAFNAGNEICWSDASSNNGTCSSPPSGADSYSYDADGNETSNGNGLSMSYNALDQTTSITSAGTTVPYTYFGEGQDQMISDGQTLHNDILGPAYQQVGSNDDYFTRSTSGQPLEQRTPNGTYDYLYDGDGSVVGLTNSTGQLVDQYAYDPYGNRTVLNNNNNIPAYFGFQSGYRTTSGVTHYGVRLYNPTDARWTQPDPLNQISSLTQSDRYQFAGDDPINAFDPRGLYDVGETLGACAGGGAQSALASGVDPVATGAGCAFGAASDFAQQVGCDTCSQVIEGVGDVIDLSDAAEAGENLADDLGDDVSDLL